MTPKYLAGILKLLKKYHKEIDGLDFEGYTIFSYHVTTNIGMVKYRFCGEVHELSFAYKKLGYKRKAKEFKWKRS